MKTKKMSLSTIQGKLSREEMKKIMAGSSFPIVICALYRCGYTPTGPTSCPKTCTCPPDPLGNGKQCTN